MDAEKKKQMLLDSYNILIQKNSSELYHADIHELIGALSKYDFNLAIELWKDAIKKHPENLHSNSTNCLGWSTKYEIERKVGEEKIDDYILNDDFLKEKLFQENGELSSFARIILYCLRRDNLKTADELLEMVNANPYWDRSLGYFLDEVFFYNSERVLSEDALNLLTEWCSKVDSEKERTALNNTLLKLNDEVPRLRSNYQWRSKYQTDYKQKCLLFPGDYETEDEYLSDLSRLRRKGMDESAEAPLDHCTCAYYFTCLSKNEKKLLYPIAFFKLNNGDFYSWIAKKEFKNENIINDINFHLPGFPSLYIKHAISIIFLFKDERLYHNNGKCFTKYLALNTVNEDQLRKEFYILVKFMDDDGCSCYDIYHQFDLIFELQDIDILEYNLCDFNVNYLVGFNERENKYYYFINGVAHTADQLDMSFPQYCKSFGEINLLEQYAKSNCIAAEDLNWNDETIVEWVTKDYLNPTYKNSVINRTSVYDGNRSYDKVIDFNEDKDIADIPAEFFKTINDSIPLTREQIRQSIIKKIQEQITIAHTGNPWIQDDDCGASEYVKAVIMYPAGKLGDIDYYLATTYGKILKQIDSLHYEIAIPCEQREIIALLAVPYVNGTNLKDKSELETFMYKYNVFYSIRLLCEGIMRWFGVVDSPIVSRASKLWGNYRAILCKRRSELYSDIIKKGKSTYKWKTESQVFSIVSTEYPDAVFQYHVEWLGYQSLDIFIPSLSTGIEYQGIQHYEPVEFFGGEEGLSMREKLDAKKRELCREHGVSLIEIKYDEPITEEQIIARIKNS